MNFPHTQHPGKQRPGRKTVATLTGCLLIGWSAAGLAGERDADFKHKLKQGGPEFPISIAEAEAKAEQRFSELDEDGNGEISRSEFDQAKRMGMGHHPGMRHGMGAKHKSHGERDDSERTRSERRNARDAALFAALDGDGDGQISSEEFDSRKLARAHRELMRNRMFERLDEDGDGSLSSAEWPSMTERLQALDSDGDGQVTREEAKAGHRAHRDSDDPQADAS